MTARKGFGVRRVWWLMVAIVAAAGMAGFFLWRPAGGSASDAAYRLAAVERGPITASVRATGTLNPVTTVLVGSQLSGQVVEILADYNTPVKEGQVVARLYSEQIKARRDAALADLAQARADRDTKQAQIEKARAMLQRAEAVAADVAAQRDRAQAQLLDAQRNFDRQTELVARAAATQNALDQAKTQLDVQKATLASAQAQIASSKAEAEGLRADLALAEAGLKSAEALILQREAKLRDIEIDLARTEIRSPVDGVVVKRDIELGQTVAASLSAPTLFTIAQDLREIDIYANIDEADVGRLKPGQPVSFTVNAYPNRTFAGTVRMVRLGAQTVQNVVTYTAVIGVQNTDLSLLPGMTANLQIVTDERDDVLRVPNAALRFRPAGTVAAAARSAAADGADAPQRRRGGTRAAADPGMEGRVYRLVNGAPELVPLRIGVTDGDYTEVLRGSLKEGDTVIVGGGARSGPQDDDRQRPSPRPRPPRMF
ncbi:efflux RND transporter periplasmic adaptor subunit [Microvirga thermotolerans]|uniref:HlyD family efflux transporter periplasmic adaptor subunit n=1 Tax=Microvirga thermotolerans TaxID=2651334 RepID=A0A5P9JWF6_9HYPH|nr:efflux RND transporter periplasmic adaptor subunit [Microvirga thermotolerans]QFU17142.1 HlyD family efflux transporter periplasmic adaptor subunit [Microvirga thermotolerans]